MLNRNGCNGAKSGCASSESGMNLRLATLYGELQFNLV